MPSAPKRPSQLPQSRRRSGVVFIFLAMWIAGLLLFVRCAAAQQGPYPKPLVHTSTNHPAARVVLLSVDGLSAAELAGWVRTHPRSALAELTARGVTYTNAHTPLADAAAGLVEMMTGGTPISTGIVNADGYDRSLSPAGSQCGTRGADLDLSADATLSPNALPRDTTHECRPVEPHELLRVNDIFEVVHAQLGRTAWAGDGAVLTDLLRGRSGAGLDDACPVARKPGRGQDPVKERHDEDERRVAFLLGWLAGRDCNNHPAAVPVLSGISLSEAAASVNALPAIDGEIASILRELRSRHLYDSTWVVVGAPFAASTVLIQARAIQLRKLREALDSVRSETIPDGVRALHISGGDTAMIWLADPSRTEDVAASLAKGAEALGIARVLSGPALTLTWNNPERDPRVPNLILDAEPGVTWRAANSNDLRSCSMSEDQTHVALLVSGAQLEGREDKTLVPTTQLAPLLLRTLGLEKFDLEALKKEHTPALPGIF